MSEIILSNMRISLLTVFLVFSGIINGQLPLNDNNSTYPGSIDTSAYIPSFYRGALDYNLMIAAAEGYASEINRLIEKGADVNAATNEGATPLVFAVSNNRLASVKALLKYNPDLDDFTVTNETPLLIAVKNRNFEITETLIRAGADVDKPDSYGATPLHYASIYGYIEIVDLLLYYDASIDSKSLEGITPLLASIRAGYSDISDLLIQNGANMEARDNDGFTPFLTATFYGDTLLMNQLFLKGVDIYATNKYDYNALCLAILSNHIEALNLLFQIGNKWSDANVNSVSPYIVASKYRRKEMIKILEQNNVPGGVKYQIDQVSLTISSRFSLHDLYPGFNLSLKEPYLNAGFIAGFDTKLWYSRVLIQNSEHLFYQYLHKNAIVYAGLFKDFVLADRPDKINVSLSTSLLAGYSLGNQLKGTQNIPENKVSVIPAVSLKLTKMNISVNLGLEYQKTEFYNNGPIWLRLGCSYNVYFDNIRTQFKNVKWFR